MEDKKLMQVIQCLTCGGTRLALTTDGGLAAAKEAIWNLPRHRGHFLVDIEATGDGIVKDVAEAKEHFIIFPQVLKPPRRVGRD